MQPTLKTVNPDGSVVFTKMIDTTISPDGIATEITFIQNQIATLQAELAVYQGAQAQSSAAIQNSVATPLTPA